MPLTTIYVTRHGFRSNWVVEKDTGIYHSSIPSPTGIPSDPALAGYGTVQSRELAEKLITLDPPIERFYSSPFYRCIQTLYPTIDKLAELEAEKTGHERELKVYGDNGLGEWFGTARFDHPSPAAPSVLKRLFPRYDVGYVPAIVPDTKGESVADLHDRTAYALHRIIEDCDRAGVKAIVICSHAATLYAIGRALTGRMPNDVSEEDFRTFTCGLSTFVRRNSSDGRQNGSKKEVEVWKGMGSTIPKVDWRSGKGVAGGWECVLNGDCSFLSGGEERGWRFSGDESFISNPDDAAGLDAGSGLGMVVEVNNQKKTNKNPSAGKEMESHTKRARL